MKIIKYFSLLVLICLVTTQVSAITPPIENKAIHWENWSETIFDKAKEENKLVILDLEAVWCHWCHVMHEKTYTDSSITKLINSHFIAARVDQDSRPDLSNRYREYGWPATIIFNSRGEELIKRAGYITPDELGIELKNVIENPIPEKPKLNLFNIKYSTEPYLSKELQEKLIEMHKTSFDTNLGGFKSYQKYLDRDTVEYSILCANNDNKEEKEMARKTLNASLMLIDPIWGGVYQYSTMGDWNYPHFEKLSTLQGEYMRIYSQAYTSFNDPKYLQAAKDIYRYIKTFLTSQKGPFYVSQDADLIQGEHSHEYFVLDDASRRKLGIPRIDKHIYSSHNGLIINGLVSLYKATNDEQYLNDAISASKWIIKHRAFRGSISKTIVWIFSNPGSLHDILQAIQWIVINKTWSERGFRHSEMDVAGPYLSDTLYMGQAFLSLYLVTNDRKWLALAEQTLRFINKNFEAPIAGYLTSKPSCETCAARRPDSLVDENIILTRLANNVFKQTQNDYYHSIAKHGMRFLATEEIATQTITEPGILLADMELKI